MQIRTGIDESIPEENDMNFNRRKFWVVLN